jgi:ABC-type transport system involved in multi-copper enzyme maturation permease subunit
MTWRTIASQDYSVTRQSRSVEYLLAILGVGILLAAYVYPVSAPDPITTARFSGYAVGWLTTLVPLVGILLGYNAVVSERESGALLLSLSLPHSREDVLLGKVASRAGLVAATILVAMAVAGFLVVYPYGELEIPRSLAFVGLTVLFSTLWTGLGVAISLSVSTKRRALALGFAALVVFVFFWSTLETLAELGLDAANLADSALAEAVQFVFVLSPNRAFRLLTAGLIDPGGAVPGPWYLGEYAAAVVFLAWLVGPLGLAFYRFAGRDLS